MWQAEQAVFAPVRLKLLLTWQEAQGTLTCAPVSGNPVALWSKFA